MSPGIASRQPTGAQRTSGFSDPAFARIAELAHLFAGLVFPPNRQPSAEAGMRRAMGVLSVTSPAQLLRVFEVPGDARDAVLAELTVGESYFFRDEAQLQLLPSEILPARRDRRGPARPLKVWSAGCASGEEPYTVALMLRERGWPHPAEILATDIARPRLAAARRGRYTRWALRGVSDERIARWFTRTGTYYDLAPSARSAVEFRHLNLVVDEYPVATAADGFDLVLCRNVMIYFDLPTVARIAAGLLASLAPDGWLLLGPSDPPLAQVVPCRSVMTSAGVAYQRADATADPPDANHQIAPLIAWQSPTVWPPSNVSAVRVALDEVPAAVTEQTPPTELAAEVSADSIASVVAAPETSELLDAAYEKADYAAAESIAMSQLASEPNASQTWIMYVRSVANQGRLHEAGELCARALELHSLDAELHYLHATLLVEAGWYVDAAAAARRSIYLDRRLVMGHMLLGDALSRTGDSAAAHIAFANALALLSDIEPAAPVQAADGVPAGRLRQIASVRLRGAEASLAE